MDFPRLKNGKGFTLVELMVVIAIIAIIAAIAIPYYINYKKSACDQAALLDLYNLKAAVQKKMADDVLGAGTVATDTNAVSRAVDEVIQGSNGKYGFPGPTAKCGVSLTNNNSVVTAKAARGTEQGIKGWSLNMIGGRDPVPLR